MVWYQFCVLSVLVTLLQISATKLLRTTVLALSPAVLSQFEPAQSSKWVWLLDGNMDYFGLEHSFIVLVVWLGISAVLLFPKYSQKLCQRISSSLALMLTNVLEAYNAPLKTKHQYWIGLTLFVRLILVISAVAFPTRLGNYQIATATLFSALLATVVCAVYKKTYLTILEACSLLNLVVLGIALLAEATILDVYHHHHWAYLHALCKEIQ